MPNDTDNNWFQHRALYQIYPRSFNDANGDGIGDLRGITAKLDYLKGKPDSLGIGAIWLSPFYPSPMADFGYDVSNYCDVDPMFGTLDDFRELLHQAHARDIKVVIDFIPNHTSDEHEWFRASRSSRDSDKRDWYIWRNAKPDGSEPNNWQSVFGGSAWAWDEATGQYYLHSFLDKQPDLNWDNPDVREAMHNQMRFWLDMGIDGFRVDAVSWLSKDADMRDNPPHPDDDADLMAIYSQDGPELFERLSGMADVLLEYPDKFMITEAYPLQWDSSATYDHFYERVNPRVCAPFNFECIFAPWEADEFKRIIDSFQASLKADYVPIYCLGNHDRSRLAERVGEAASRTAGMMLLTLPGMPTMYYGEELGMVDGVITPDLVQDPYEINVPGKGNGRDPERTPMQWSAEPGAGFTSGMPWLPINTDHQAKNVQQQSADPTSHLSLYRHLLKLREKSVTLQSGKYVPLETPQQVFGYRRVGADESLTVLLNFSGELVGLPAELTDGEVVLSTYLDGLSSGVTALRPHEGIILRNS